MAGNLTEKEIIEYKEAFALFDKNDDGFIKRAEVKDILVSLGMEGSCEEADHVIRQIDTDGLTIFTASKGQLLYMNQRWRTNEIGHHDFSDGVINFPEFLNMMAAFRAAGSAVDPGSELEHMFQIFDRDGDGLITHSEMKRALDETGGGPVPHSEVESMIKQADQDGDGKLSFEEFKAIMKNTHPNQYH